MQKKHGWIIITHAETENNTRIRTCGPRIGTKTAQADRLTALSTPVPKHRFPGWAACRTDSTLVEREIIFSKSAEESRCPVERRRHVVERPNKALCTYVSCGGGLSTSLRERLPQHTGTIKPQWPRERRGHRYRAHFDIAASS